MDTNYRGRQLMSRLERLLAQLVVSHPRRRSSEPRVDLGFQSEASALFIERPDQGA